MTNPPTHHFRREDENPEEYQRLLDKAHTENEELMSNLPAPNPSPKDPTPYAGMSDDKLGTFLREDAAAIRRGGFVGSGEAFARRLERAAELICATAPDPSQSKSVEREEIARLRLFAEGISADGNREDDVDDVMCRIYHLLGFEDGLRADILALIGSTNKTSPAPRGEEGFKELWQKLLDKPDDEPITYEEAESFYLAGLAAAPKAPGPNETQK